MSKNKSQGTLELRKQLKAYVSQAQQNEQKLQKMQQQELKFISAEGIDDLFHTIFQDYRAEYELDYVTLFLIDPNYELRHVVEAMHPDLINSPTLLFSHTHTQLESLMHAKALQNEQAPGHFQSTLIPDLQDEPYLGHCSETCKQILFPALNSCPESIAILPLIRHHKLIGALNLASNVTDRFVKGSATDFMKRLSAILAVCIENAFNTEKLKLLGLTDALTGIHNRRYFMQRLSEEMTRTYRHKQPLSCLFIDIDHFKAFNDIYGHTVGDQVLSHVARIIKEQMRSCDVLARYGGEEFAILLVDAEENMAVEIAERIRTVIENSKLYCEDAGEELGITASIGCSTITQQHHDLSTLSNDALLNAADHALYAAKSSGRNTVKVTDFTSQVKGQLAN